MFQAAGPATLKARSPNFNDVRGTSKALLSADYRPGCLVVTYCKKTARRRSSVTGLSVAAD